MQSHRLSQLMNSLVILLTGSPPFLLSKNFAALSPAAGHGFRDFARRGSRRSSSTFADGRGGSAAFAASTFKAASNCRLHKPAPQQPWTSADFGRPDDGQTA